jgi:hypothetical protein
MRHVFLALALLLVVPAAHAFPVWCKLTNNVVTGGCDQAGPPDSTYTQMDSTDARYTTFITSSPQALATQAEAALSNSDAGTVTLTSTGTPALNGTYPINTSFMISALAEEECLLATTTNFCNGTTSLGMPDTSGTLHTFTKSQFNQFMLQVVKYRNAVYYDEIISQNGGAVTLPSHALTIP